MKVKLWRLNRSFRAGYTNIRISLSPSLSLSIYIYIHPQPYSGFLKQNLFRWAVSSCFMADWAVMVTSIQLRMTAQWAWVSRFGPIVLKRPQKIRCCRLVWLGHFFCLSIAIDKHPWAFVLLNWQKVTNKKSSKLCLYWCTTSFGGAKINVPLSLCTWRRTILPSVGVQLLPWRVSWWRWVESDGFFGMNFCGAFHFLFSPLQKGMCFSTNTWDFPSCLACTNGDGSAGMARWASWIVDGGNFWLQSLKVQKLSCSFLLGM